MKRYIRSTNETEHDSDVLLSWVDLDKANSEIRDYLTNMEWEERPVKDTRELFKEFEDKEFGESSKKDTELEQTGYSYTWVRTWDDDEYVKTYNSLEKAEEGLNRDINEVLEALDDFDDSISYPHRNTLKYGEREITARDGYDVVRWERMYNPSIHKNF